MPAAWQADAQSSVPHSISRHLVSRSLILHFCHLLDPTRPRATVHPPQQSCDASAAMPPKRSHAQMDPSPATSSARSLRPSNVQGRVISPSAAASFAATSERSHPSPFSRLYRDALESILAFGDLRELRRCMLVCRAWLGAVVHMRPLQLSCQIAYRYRVPHDSRALVHLGSLNHLTTTALVVQQMSASPLSRHVGQSHLPRISVT